MNDGRGLATRLLSSPRRRRRLGWVGSFIALAGVLTFVGFHYSNTAKRVPEHFSSGPVQRVGAPPQAAVLSSVDQESVRKVAELFVDTAVLRRRLDDSWEITTPKLRQGLTRKEWDTGNIPMTPFPADAVGLIKYRLDWSGVDLVYLKIAIVPKPASKVDGQAFDMGLARNGAAESHDWLVDYWVPSGIGVSTSGRSGPLGAVAATPSASRVPAALIFVPLGLIVALVAGLPLVVFGRSWLRGRRAVREYKRSSA